MRLKWTADRRLVRRTLAGDKAAGELLVANHYNSVLRFLLHLTRDPHEADELAQDVFVKAWQKLHTFEGRSTFRTWVHLIAYREFASRKQLPDTVELEESLADDRADFAASIVGTLAIEAAISSLPEILRIAFVTCHVHEISIRDASTILGIPEGTVSSRLAAARVHLKRRLVMRDVATFSSLHETIKPPSIDGPLNYEMSKTIQ